MEALEFGSSLMQAAYAVAHDYKGGAGKGGGAVKMAEELSENPGTFLNRVNPQTDLHKLWILLALRMELLSGDHRILHAYAAELGEVCFNVPDLANVSDAALLELICKIGKEGGDFHRVINDGLQDTRFSLADYERIHQEGLEYIAAITETMARIKGLIDG